MHAVHEPRRIPRAEAKQALREMLIDAARERGTVTYSDVSVRVFEGRVPARSRYIMDLLTEVDEEEHASTGVIIASLVVRADSGIPGAGYFTFLARRFGRDITDPRAAWSVEAEKVWATYCEKT